MGPLLDLAIRAATDAGAVLLEHFESDLEIEIKSSAMDLVTAADRAAEEVIVRRIRSEVPDHGILAEESGQTGHDQSWMWIIDPLDGTTNYAHGFPQFCVSIAAYEQGEPRLGVVLDPTRGEVFFASRGEGTWLRKAGADDRRLAVTEASELASSLLATGFAYNWADDSVDNIPYFVRMMDRARGIRRPGSAALDLAYVAAGRLDGFWEYNLQPWDTAAGAVLIEEAGGQVRSVEQVGWDPWRRSIVASNPVLLAKLCEALEA